jgi:serine/threonine-protein kinase
VTQIGPYLVEERLGQGGMAEVFRCVAYGASGFEKRVAVKRLLPELRGVPELERWLIEEAKLGARLQHSNLVQVHQLGIDDGSYYVVLELVDGRDLATLSRRGPPPPELALFIAEKVALALDHVHRATDDAGRPLGLVHRDVSPSNVLVSREGEVKLADFGVAKATALADVTRANVRKGKYAYMSPEQVAGEPIGPASDQFGLGIMLMELLGAGRPFDGEGPHETMDRIRRADPPDVTALPAAVRQVVLTCLARIPSDRHASTLALHRALAEARRTLPVGAEPELAAWMRRD